MGRGERPADYDAGYAGKCMTERMQQPFRWLNDCRISGGQELRDFGLREAAPESVRTT